MTKTLKSIEIDAKKHIYKINGEEMDIHQNWFKIECFNGKWHLEESIDIYYYPEKKKTQKQLSKLAKEMNKI